MVTKPIKDPHHYHWRHHPAITSKKKCTDWAAHRAAGPRGAMTTPDLFTTAPWRLGKDTSETCFCTVGYIIYIYVYIYISYFICTYMYVVCAYPCIIYIYIYLDVCNIYVYMYIHIYTLIRQLALYIMYSMNQSCIYLYTFSVRTCNICVHTYIYQQYIHTWYVPIHPKIWDWYEQQPQVQTP